MGSKEVTSTPSTPCSNWLRNLKNYLGEYCANTTIHGLRFVGEQGRSIVERICWVVVLVVSLYFCMDSILDAYEKWRVSPVVVSFSTSEIPVWRIPFPAVTICPQIKTYRHLVNFTHLVLKRRSGVKLDRNEQKTLEYMSLICVTKWSIFKELNLTEIIDGEDVIDFFMKTQPKFYDTAEKCYWLGKDCSKDIDDLFMPLITIEGMCFSFNLLDRDEIFTDVVADYYKRFAIPHQPPSRWTLEKGYEENSDLDSYPRRTIVGGTHGGLDLTFYLNSSDIDYLCGDSILGYKVGLDQDATVVLKPNIMTTAKQLEHYTPMQRKCFFTAEKKLRYFKVYDQQNCLHECASNFTYRHCGCVDFSMIRDNTMEVCGPGMRKCVEEAGATFLAREIKIRLKYNKSRPVSRKKWECGCFPTCNSLTFDAEISQSKWSWRQGAKILHTPQENVPGIDHFSRLQIFFKDMQFMASERNELYGQMDFLASCGGLLGLFIGFSLISVVEIVYYATLRFAYNLRKYGSQNWAGGSEHTAETDALN